eukprot:1184540-Prorocentrum_minimum.AAC.2
MAKPFKQLDSSPIYLEQRAASTGSELKRQAAAAERKALEREEEARALEAVLATASAELERMRTHVAASRTVRPYVNI